MSTIFHTFPGSFNIFFLHDKITTETYLESFLRLIWKILTKNFSSRFIRKDITNIKYLLFHANEETSIIVEIQFISEKVKTLS